MQANRTNKTSFSNQIKVKDSHNYILSTIDFKYKFKASLKLQVQADIMFKN